MYLLDALGNLTRTRTLRPTALAQLFQSPVGWQTVKMRSQSFLLVTASLLLPSPAMAWGYEGHEIVATIARTELTPAVRSKVDAILAADTDTLTGTDMVSRSTWADAWRSAGHRETAQWHFVDTELDGPDLNTACFGYPAAGDPASAGPATDCVVDKIREFTVELASPTTAPSERLLALKYLLHFVGDVHQPLHASDNHDRGGNCVLVSLGGNRTVNLHAYWDTAVVEAALGKDVATAAATLDGRITSAQRTAWRRGDAASWATESFQVARSTVYTIGSPAYCQSDVAPITISPGYAAAAQTAVQVQLQRAGVRLAMVLNTALATVAVTPSVDPPASMSNATLRDRTSRSAPPTGRSPASLACSADADAKGLHGKTRQQFRRHCIRDRDGS